MLKNIRFFSWSFKLFYFDQATGTVEILHWPENERGTLVWNGSNTVQGHLVFSRWTFRASWKPSSSVPGSSITCVDILRYTRWSFQSPHQCFILHWSCFATLFVGADSPGHESDQSCPWLEEEPGAVCVQGEGHADTQQLSGGLLDRKPEEPQPEGAEQPFSTTGESCFSHILSNKWWNVLQGEEILSQRSQESEDDEEGEAEQRTPLPQDQSEDEVRAF